MILGKKHYPRTIKNIETRQRQLSGVYTALQRADKSKEAQKMMRIINRAIVRYELALIRIYRQIALSHKNYLIGQGRWDASYENSKTSQQNKPQVAFYKTYGGNLKINLYVRGNGVR